MLDRRLARSRDARQIEMTIGFDDQFEMTRSMPDNVRPVGQIVRKNRVQFGFEQNQAAPKSRPFTRSYMCRSDVVPSDWL